MYIVGFRQKLSEHSASARGTFIIIYMSPNPSSCYNKYKIYRRFCVQAISRKSKIVVKREITHTHAHDTYRELRDAMYRNLNPRKRAPEIVILLPPSPRIRALFPVRVCSTFVRKLYTRDTHVCV